MRRALARLEREGRIIRRRGSGTYAACLPQSSPRLSLELQALPASLAILESRTTATTLRFDPAPPTLRAIAAEFGATA